jgi:hypothetical protein
MRSLQNMLRQLDQKLLLRKEMEKKTRVDVDTRFSSNQHVTFRANAANTPLMFYIRLLNINSEPPRSQQNIGEAEEPPIMRYFTASWSLQRLKLYIHLNDSQGGKSVHCLSRSEAEMRPVHSKLLPLLQVGLSAANSASNLLF